MVECKISLFLFTLQIWDSICWNTLQSIQIPFQINLQSDNKFFPNSENNVIYSLQNVRYFKGRHEAILANYGNLLGLLPLKNDKASTESFTDSLSYFYRSSRSIEYIAVSDDYQFIGLCLNGDRSIIVSLIFYDQRYLIFGSIDSIQNADHCVVFNFVDHKIFFQRSQWLCRDASRREYGISNVYTRDESFIFL